MRLRGAPPSEAVDQPPFKYVGGDPSLDFVNTVDWTSRGLEGERFSAYDRLVRWAEGAGLMPATAATGLLARASARPAEASAALAAALELRSVLRTVFVAAADGTPPGPALDRFNGELAIALGQLRLGRVAGNDPGPRARWEWRGAEERLDSLLWPVAWSAAALLTGDEAARIRVCGGLDCGWVYVDRSRNRLRRWCEMEICGTREKSRRRAERQNRARPTTSPRSGRAGAPPAPSARG